MMETVTQTQNERTSPSFILFLVWTFVAIARPQDYMSFLLPVRPILAMTILTLIVMFFEKKGLPEKLLSLPEVRLAVILYIVLLMGVPFAVHRGTALRFALTGLPAIIIYFIVSVIQLRSLRRLNLTAVVIGISILFSASLYTIEALNYPGARAGASEVYGPNDIAMVFTTFIPICLYLLLGDFSIRTKVLAATAVLLGTAGVMLSLSRGGALALGIVILIFLWSRAPEAKKAAKIAIAAVLIFVFAYNFSAVGARFENIGRDYNIDAPQGRLHIWKQSLALISESPFGSGAGCSRAALGFYRQEVGGTQLWQVTHSSLLQMAVEGGIPGFIIYALLNILAIANLRRIRRDKGHPLSHIAFFTQLSMYGFWVGGLLLSQAYSINLFVLLGISGALRYLYKHPEASSA